MKSIGVLITVNTTVFVNNVTPVSLLFFSIQLII